MQTRVNGCTGEREGVCGKNEDIQSLQQTILLGLKGISAYATHARELGYTDPMVNETLERGLYFTLTNVNFNLNDHVKMAMDVGQATIKVMELLDKAHTDRLGLPQPVTVSQNKAEGKCILVTGHNLLALEELLKQSAGKGINVYTHSEMLPAHGYPELKKYPHLKGNIGGAWHDQRKVFEEFPGAILGTTNCVMPITGTYADRFFAYDVTGLEGVQKIEGNDFTPLIEKALSLPEADLASDQTLTTGFHHENVLALAPEIIEAVKAGKIRRFFLIGGCSHGSKQMQYYRELAQKVPQDCVILTLACGKFNFNDLDYGTIDGIPRFIDLGQCNNSISAVKIALALADAFGCSVNELPLTIVLSWFEQKAVAILLGLFSLGVNNIYLGPKPPHWITPAVLQVLQDNFDLHLTSTADQDLKAFLG